MFFTTLNSRQEWTILRGHDTHRWIQHAVCFLSLILRKVVKGAVVIKLWDLGGQARYRHLLLTLDSAQCGSVTVAASMPSSTSWTRPIMPKYPLQRRNYTHFWRNPWWRVFLCWFWETRMIYPAH